MGRVGKENLEKKAVTIGWLLLSIMLITLMLTPSSSTSFKSFITSLTPSHLHSVSPTATM